jgi:hypothetical protein
MTDAQLFAFVYLPIGVAIAGWIYAWAIVKYLK